MRLVLLFLCFSALLYDVSSVSSDGVTLLSLLRHWTFVPPSINSSWNANDSSSCSWVGIKCNRAHNLISLNLSGYGISGQLGPEIGQLNHLQTIVLSTNHFFGPIPLELGNCSVLVYLDLSENNFNGPIPYSLNRLLNLQYISLHSNMLTGEIPESLFVIPHLEEVSLYNNSLIGIIPNNIGNLSELLRLHLSRNSLSGNIPSSIGNCSKLEELFLDYNRLMGEIPVGIWKITSLRHIIVHNNSLYGELPQEMTELKHLENISLFDNQFSGVIPQSLGINSSLVLLDLMNNKFTGTLPPHLCFGKQLHMLNMGFNQLQGAIPADVGTCTSLRRLTLNQNKFIGPLPLFQNNPSLQYMDLRNNNISGEIPSSLGKCTNLTDVNLSMNKFTGLIPQELGKLVNVRTLNLAHNNLVGPLPSKLSNCNKMDSFDVGFNFLNGSFPSSLRSWTGITTLVLRENHFTGGIPAFLSEFGMLWELQLGGNLFGGKIPESIGNLRNLMYGLNLSSNGLIGEVPLTFYSLDKLQILDLSHNNLTGSVGFLGSLSSIVEVNISYNFFYGPVPKILLNSAPSSYLGNPSLLFCCPGSACTSETSYLKPCSDKSTDHKGTKRIVHIVMIELAALAALIFIALLLVRRVYFSVDDAQEDEIHDDAGVSLMKEVMEATANLDDNYIIGRGAHGVVYKALLGTYRVFAVKKVQYGENKGKILSMRREIQTIGLVRHRNLIRFQNFWSGKDYGLIFYEYMENGSLHDVLHVKKPAPALEWNIRYKIAVGIAHALKYLHYDCDPPIVHRDIKPKNILLDSNMEPHVSDFGIAMHIAQSSAPMRTLRSTYIAGTVGYMAPENAYTIVQSGKSDVYSYGVVLLELITRKMVLDPSFNDQTTLMGWVRSVWEETPRIEKIVDPSLVSEFSDSTVRRQVTQVVKIAFRCIERNPNVRPSALDIIKQI